MRRDRRIDTDRGDTERLDAFVADLRREVTGDVRTDAWSRVFYSTDASIYKVMPLGVLIPERIEDVLAAMTLAHEHGIPILPRAGGTSLAGQTVNEALVIDFTRHLNRIVEVDPETRRVKVQPGLVLDHLNAALARHGLMFGPDPASSNRAALGGVIGNNATGSHSILYGMAADHVIGMQVFLADGSVVRFGPADDETVSRRAAGSGREAAIYRAVEGIARDHADTILAGTPKHWRRCGGYNLDRFVDGAAFRVAGDERFNLAKLVCGSEGTLAVMGEIELGLVERPAATGLAVVQFEELFAALASVPMLLEAGPSAVELFDRIGITLCRGVPVYARLLESFLEGDPNCILITEFYGANTSEVASKIAAYRDHVSRRVPGAHVVPVLDAARQQNVWNVRKAGLGLMMSIKGDHKPVPFIEDAAVPVESLADYVTSIERFCHEMGTKVAYYAHASAGCIHIRPLLDLKTATEVAKLEQISSFALELITRYGGSWSSEHGDGRSRSPFNERFFGPALMGLYREVKTVFDPDNRLNPGNIVGPARPIGEALRYGERYRTAAVTTALDFRPEHGFDRAIEMCNGAGICRKTTGSMCPSFMVTHEEEHSTRGRANALRAALAGELPAGAFDSERMFEVMDLCVECKACKAECPSSVDMAKIKTEFLAQYYKRHRAPLRNRLFARMPREGRLWSGWRAPIVNWIGERRFARSAVGGLLGVTAKRRWPRFARRPLRAGEGRVNQGGARRVVLFADTFATWFEPEVGRAAVRVLAAGGFDVHVVTGPCCGRTALSKGRIEEARRAAAGVVEALAPFATDGVPIVGLEPSCLLTIADEFPSLFPDDGRVRDLAHGVRLLDSFVADEKAAYERCFRRTERAAIVHGHCHQRALVGLDGTATALALAGFDATVLDASCCGMAGAFGYEREHYDISLAMGERVLFPAVRAAPEAGVIVAPGFSCRAQIEHGAGRAAAHPAVVLAEALRD